MILNDFQLPSGLLLIIHSAIWEKLKNVTVVYLCTLLVFLMLSEQRTRIYSPRTIDSGLGSLQSLQSAHHTPDESVEIEEDEPELFDSPTGSLSFSRSFSSTLPGSEERQQRCGGLSSGYEPVPPSSMLRKYPEPLRPISGPVVTTRRKFRYHWLSLVSSQSVIQMLVSPVISTCSQTSTFSHLLTQSVDQSVTVSVSLGD